MGSAKTRVYTFRYYKDGQLVSMSNMDFQSDAEAVEVAREAQFDFGLEIWDDGRLVATFRDDLPNNSETS